MQAGQGGTGRGPAATRVRLDGEPGREHRHAPGQAGGSGAGSEVRVLRGARGVGASVAGRGAAGFGGACLCAGPEGRTSAGLPASAWAQGQRARHRRGDRYQRQQRDRGREGQRLVTGEQFGGLAVEGQTAQIAAQMQHAEQRDQRTERAGHRGGDRREQHQPGRSQADREEAGPGTSRGVGTGHRHRELHGGGERRETPREPDDRIRGLMRVPHREPQGAQEQEACARRRRRYQEPAQLDGGPGAPG